MMNIILIVLKSETILISQTELFEYEPKVHLIRPHVVSGTTNVSLKPWPSYTEDHHLLLNSDSLLTDCEPSDKVLKAYMKKCNIKEEDLLPKKAEPVILNEEVPEIFDDEDYEPRYIEE